MSAQAATELDHRPIRFRIRFTVSAHQAAAFLGMLEGDYVPALTSQDGFRAARILVPYPEDVSVGIGATAHPGVYELEFDFDSEPARRAWVAQPIHDRLWQRAVESTEAQEWSGFLMVGEV